MAEKTRQTESLKDRGGKTKAREPASRDGPEPESGRPDGILRRAATDLEDVTPTGMRGLQRTIGNQAVGRLAIQAKLTVGAANDPAEHEADVVARQVVSMPEPHPATAVGGQTQEDETQKQPVAAPPVRRASADPKGSFEPGSRFESRLKKGGGSPLPSATRAFMEPRFGADFGGVRLHTGGESAALNREIDAQAFTHGKDIYLGEGKHDVESGAGKQLLAHELTHTIQQGEAGPPAPRATALQRQASASPDIHARVAALLQSPDPHGVNILMDDPDFGRVTEAERLGVIRVANQFGGGDAGRLARLWAGFGDGRLPAVVVAHMPDWEASIRFWPGLPDLIPAVSKVEQAFRAALLQLAESNLSRNADYVEQRMEQFGFAAGATKPMTPAEMTAYRRSVQQIAYQVWALHQEQQKARRIEIGRTVGRMSLPITFDPSSPHAHEGPGSVDVELWAKIKAEWDKAERPVAAVAANYPEIYEAAAQGNDDALLRFSRAMPEDPNNPAGSSMGAAPGQGFEGQAKGLLISLAGRIHKAQAEVGGLDMLELPPLQKQLYAGHGRWNGGFDRWVAERAVVRHERDAATMKVLADMGEGAAALVATFASGGMALAFGAIAAGGGVARAAVDLAEAGRLDTAAKATPIRGTELVSRAQADAKMIQGGAELFAAIVAAFLIGGAKGLEYLEGRLTRMLEGLVADEAVRSALLAKVSDKKELIRLLGKADSPAELKTLLDARAVAAAETLLDLRAASRARVSSLRAQYAERLEANPAIAKDLEAAEAELKDPANVESAEKQIDQVVGRLFPQTLPEVKLVERIGASGMTPRQAGDFFGWEKARVSKGIGDFTKDQLLAKGWTKERLINVAQGYEDIARITPDNPSAASRVAQLRELAGLFP
jgi:hypothetical protein